MEIKEIDMVQETRDSAEEGDGDGEGDGDL
jgi:hypothetical protein